MTESVKEFDSLGDGTDLATELLKFIGAPLHLIQRERVRDDIVAALQRAYDLGNLAAWEAKAESFGKFWENRRAIVQHWDAKDEELRHMATWFEAGCWAIALSKKQPELHQKLYHASIKLGPWMSAAMEDDKVCSEMKEAADAFLWALHHLTPKENL